MRMRVAVGWAIAGWMGLAAPAAAQGQKGAIELGLDAAFVVQVPRNLQVSTASGPVDVDLDNVTALQWPLQFIRVGYYIGDHAEIEVRTSVDFVDVGDFSPTSFTLDIAYGYNFGAPGQTRYFVGVGGGIDYYNEEAHPYREVPPALEQMGLTGVQQVSNVVRYGVGVGAGAKIPLQPQLAVRLEGNWSYDIEKEAELLPAQHNIVARVGISYFTK
ncbi:MAG: outer membrane beta-barrel protein [Gemmatimonadota bacterium]